MVLNLPPMAVHLIFSVPHPEYLHLLAYQLQGLSRPAVVALFHPADAWSVADITVPQDFAVLYPHETFLPLFYLCSCSSINRSAFCPRLFPLFNTAFSFAIKQLTGAQLFLDRTQHCCPQGSMILIVRPSGHVSPRQFSSHIKTA
jgi:hypothetical protein